MNSDAVSEVFGAILAIGITTVVVLGAIFIFDDANDAARQQSAVTEAVAVAESIDESILSLMFFYREPSVTSYETELDLPAAIQGNAYNFSRMGDNLSLTANQIQVVYPLQSASIACTLTIDAQSSSATARYTRSGAACTIDIS